MWFLYPNNCCGFLFIYIFFWPQPILASIFLDNICLGIYVHLNTVCLLVYMDDMNLGLDPIRVFRVGHSYIRRLRYLTWCGTLTITGIYLGLEYYYHAIFVTCKFVALTSFLAEYLTLGVDDSDHLSFFPCIGDITVVIVSCATIRKYVFGDSEGFGTTCRISVGTTSVLETRKLQRSNLSHGAVPT